METKKTASETVKNGRPIIYFDMDGVLVDFASGIKAAGLSKEETERRTKEKSFDEIPGIFGMMKPTYGAVRGIKELARHYELHILSTAPWGNPSAWSDKLEWVKRYFDNTVEGYPNGNPFYKHVTITHRKDRVYGAVLVDDNLSKNGADKFLGEKVWFHFRGNRHASCPELLQMLDIKEVTNWWDLLDYLMPEKDESWKQYEDELFNDMLC